MASEAFDVVVIGAGPSGLGAAYMLAKYGFNVVVVERGGRVGSKNVFGGRIYSHVFEKAIPGFRKEAPIERWVKKERLSFLTDEDAVVLEFSSRYPEAPNDSFTAYLSAFTRWLAKKAEEAGALVVTGFRVDGLIVEDGQVRGVISGADRIRANVVVDAEGVNPIIARSVGLRDDWGQDDVAIGVKEVVKLPRGVIEERFDLDEDEGLAQLFVGYPSKYAPGGAFLYTNKEAVTIGVVVKLDHAARRNIAVYDVVEDFRQHPYVKRLLKGGAIIEYAAHLIPEVGVRGIPAKLCADGILLVGDVAGLTLNTGLTVRGVDLAFWSGVLAAEAIRRAHDGGKYTAEALSHYEELLRKSFIFEELNAFKRTPSFLENERIYDVYPRVLCDFLRTVYTVDGVPKRVYKSILEATRGRISLATMVKDVLAALRSL